VTRANTAPLAVAGLVGGFAAARYTHRRDLGGAVFALAGAACTRSWLRAAGPARTGVLLATYTAAMGASHPLAKKIGAWPSVAAVSAATAAAARMLADRSAHTV
jgi:hypothetical protein